MSNNRVIRPDDPVRVEAWKPGDLQSRPPVKSTKPPLAVRRQQAEAERNATAAATSSVVASVSKAAAPSPLPAASVAKQVAEAPDPLAQARAEAERLRAEAKKAGFDQGHAEGLRQAADDVQQIRSVLARLNTLAEDLEQGVANDVLSLSLELAKQIVRQSLRVKPELVLAVIRDATKTFPELGDGPRLILHPADAAIVRAVVAEDAEMAAANWVLMGDARLERGSCKFQNATTEIDATRDNRWRRIVASLGRDDAWLDLNL